jgi:hypothetical protein
MFVTQLLSMVIIRQNRSVRLEKFTNAPSVKTTAFKFFTLITYIHMSHTTGRFQPLDISHNPECTVYLLHMLFSPKPGLIVYGIIVLLSQCYLKSRYLISGPHY